MIAAGAAAPDFSLEQEDGERFTAASLEVRHTVLVFYPFAFSPICTEQLTLYEEVLDEFGERGARLYGVSCDSVHAQRAFRESLGVTIEQLSDWEPKGAACEAFGVLHRGGFPQRAIVMLDSAGVVEWSYQADSPGDLPGANLIFDALAAVPASGTVIDDDSVRMLRDRDQR
ncbi:MAG: redoxin domain-containing protein [Solirubrobacteraceae bacterium]